MKKWLNINGKPHVIKTRELYAPKQKVVKSKKIYNRKEKKNGNWKQSQD